MKMLRFTLIALFVLVIFDGFAQNNKKFKKADDTFDAGEYFRANEMYFQIYGKLTDKKTKAEIAFKMAECNRHLNLPKQAEKWYSKAVIYKYPNPLASLYYADALKMNDKYEEAKIEYEKYFELAPDDIRATNGIESCKSAIEWKKNPAKFIITNVKDINSKQSDFAPCYAGDVNELFFTSAREGVAGNKLNEVSGINFTDIFFTKLDKKGKWSVPVPLQGEVNSVFDEGAATLSKNKSILFFTSCKMEKNKNLGCQIYTSESTENKWSDIKLIQLVSDSSISVGHPSISADNLTLYFASDMKGGLGGKDIWKVERASENSSWSKPINLGETFNTQGNESYPFIREDGVLFFSTDSRIGMGGLDIFKATPDGSKWKIENMKYPINSAADDFGFICDSKGETGFFTSSRAEGKGSDDIYSFESIPLQFVIKGIVKNDENGILIYESKVNLVGSDGTSLETLSGVDGSFTFALKPGTDYVITTTKDKYLKGKGKESTKGLVESKTLEIIILMTPVFNPIEIPNIEYDFGKDNLREESKVALDGLVETLKENDNITIELGAHTDFRGTSEANTDLSQRRAQSVVTYLISKGIKTDRLVAKGYGESQPVLVSVKIAEKYPFLKEGDLLNEDFINHLSTTEQKEIAHQLNRRTQFKVISTTYKETGLPFGN